MARPRSAGLDIGTSAVRAVELSTDRSGVRVQRYGEVSLPVGAVVDGEINDPIVVTAAVKQLWKTHGFKAKRVALSVANRRVLVRQISLPWVAPAEMREALYFQAQDLLPVALEDSVLDHHPLEEFIGEGGARMLRLMLVAADGRMVRRVVEVARDAGLKPQLVDLTPFAVLRAVATLDSSTRAMADLVESTEAEAVVDVGAAVTNILVHTAGRPRFVRLLMLGGGNVTEQIAESLGVPFEEAEDLKQTRSMQSVDGAFDSTDGEEDPAGRALELAASTLVNEVRGSLDYYRAQPDALPLSRIVVCGGGSRLGNLPARLGVATRLPVVRLGEISDLVLPVPRRGEPTDRSEPTDLPVVPIGLAMRAAS